jgi:hypothetical protein
MKPAVVIVVSAVLAVAACGGSESRSKIAKSPVDVATLTERSACADTSWYAENSDHTARLTVRTTIAHVRDENTPPHHVFDLSDGTAAVGLNVGKDLGVCSHYGWNLPPEDRVDEAWTAVRGTVTVDLEPEIGSGTVTLEDVVMRGADGAEFALTDMSWSSDEIGVIFG